MSGVTQDDLDALNGPFAGTDPTERNNTEPDGKHEFQVDSAIIDKSKSEEMMIVYTLKVLDFDLGKNIKKFAMLTKNKAPDKERMGWVKGELKRLGYDVTDMDSLEETLIDLRGKVIEGTTVTIKKKGGDTYTNRYFNELVFRNEPIEENNTESGPEEKVEDIPF